MKKNILINSLKKRTPFAAVTIQEKLIAIKKVKFSFGKDFEQLYGFSKQVNALCMHDPNFGLGISPYISSTNQMISVLEEIMNRNGYFCFNLNYVNLQRAVEGLRIMTRQQLTA